MDEIREAYASKGFTCPNCRSVKFGTVRLVPVHIIKCHGLSSDGPPFGCGWQGTWEQVREFQREQTQAPAAGKEAT